MLGAGETVIGQTERLVADRDWRGLYRLAGTTRPSRRTPRARRGLDPRRAPCAMRP